MTLTVSHNFVSPIVDQADPNLLGPDEWNDDHTTSMATNKLLGRATAGAGAIEEITLGTNLSFTGTTLNAAGGAPSAPSGSVQFNNGGSFGGDAAFSVPSIGTVTLGALASATRAQFEFVAEDGTNVTIQPLPATTNWTFSLPTSGGTNTYVLQTDGTGITSWVPQTGASGNITVGATTVLGGTTKHVIYDLAGIFEEAANFTIESGNPNVTAGNSYKYGGINAIRADLALTNWLFGNSGNLTATGTGNMGFGDTALQALTSGNNNCGVGIDAAKRVTSGANNVALGTSSLTQVTTQNDNVAIGLQSLVSATGASNVGIGSQAGINLTSGGSNVLIGVQAGNALVTQSNSIAIGYQCLLGSAAGSNNVGIGYQALSNCSSTSATRNVAIGTQCGGQTSGADSLTIGYQAGAFLTSGDKNTFLGGFAGTTVSSGSQNIVIGYSCDIPTGTANGQLSIGNYIYGTGLTGTGSTISTAKIGIGIKAPACELDVGGIISTKGYTIAATLPVAGTVGRRAYVTDSAAAPVFMAVAAGGGTTVVPVFDDGTNWIYA